MSYDPNSIEAKKGALGEKIVKGIFESFGYSVQRGDEHGEKSLMDFLVVFNANPDDTHYVEVKVRSAMPYAHGQYPCYSFPVVQIEAYEKFISEKETSGVLWIVDPKEGVALSGYLGQDFSKRSLEETRILERTLFLEKKQFIDGKEFPFDQETKYGNYRFFHRQQFILMHCLTRNEINKFHHICIEDAAQKADEQQSDETSTPPNFDFLLETKQESPASAKSLVEKLAAFVNVGKADLTQSILDLRQKKFDREQAQMKELLI